MNSSMAYLTKIKKRKFNTEKRIKKNILKNNKNKISFIKSRKVRNIIIIIIGLFIIFLCLLFYFFLKIKKLNYPKNIFDLLNHNKTNFKLDYESNTFAILKRYKCDGCGLFSHYKIFLGCVNHHLANGEIPIIDLQSYRNLFNNYSLNSTENPWEFFFSQVDGYNLNDVLKYAKNIKYYNCHSKYLRPSKHIFFNKFTIRFWHNIANIYMKIQDNILKEANSIIKKLFKGNKNVLGILMRGTDYITKRPSRHPIPPKTETVINDIIEMDKKNNYKYFFLATEDDIIRNKFIKEFGAKLKYFKYKEDLNYNYKRKKYLNIDNKIVGNLEFIKIYLINIIILSKCIDFITARTNGSMGVLIFTEGFRNTKIYDLGNYRYI